MTDQLHSIGPSYAITDQRYQVWTLIQAWTIYEWPLITSVFYFVYDTVPIKIS